MATYGVLGTGTVGRTISEKPRLEGPDRHREPPRLHDRGAVAGNEQAAKAEVTELLRSFGWRDVPDLGDVSAARGLEAYLLLWIRGMQTIGPTFNVKVQR
jgi:predicted dinucleotide-binding enzyme